MLTWIFIHRGSDIAVLPNSLAPDACIPFKGGCAVVCHFPLPIRYTVPQKFPKEVFCRIFKLHMVHDNFPVVGIRGDGKVENFYSDIMHRVVKVCGFGVVMYMQTVVYHGDQRALNSRQVLYILFIVPAQRVNVMEGHTMVLYVCHSFVVGLEAGFMDRNFELL